MSLPNEQPGAQHPNYTYTQGGAVFGNLTAGRDIKINHITTVRPLAQSLYQSCFTSSEIFSQFQNELGSLVAVLGQMQKQSLARRSKGVETPELDRALETCYQVLTDLSEIKEHFDGVDTQTQTTWERMGWGVAELADIRARMSTCIQTLTLLTATQTQTSHANLERMVMNLFEEIRSGRRDGSVVSTLTDGSHSMTEKEKWRVIRKELETVGITSEMFSQNIDFIKSTIATAVRQGALGDVYHELQYSSDSDPSTALVPRKQHKQHKRPSTAVQADMGRPEHYGMELGAEKSKQASRKNPSRIVRMLYAVSHDVNDLYQAIDSGNSSRVQQLVEKGADVSKGLDFAIRSRNVAMLKQLLVYFGGHSTEVKEGFKLAAEIAHRGMARVILEHMDDAGRTDAMLHSAHFGYSWTVRMFKELGKGPNTYLNGTTALIMAAQYSYVSYAEVLLKNGADVNMQTGKHLSYKTAFGTAMRNPSPFVRFKMAKLFISYGLDIHGGNGSLSPLTIAQEVGQQNIITLLKKAGARY